MKLFERIDHDGKGVLTRWLSEAPGIDKGQRIDLHARLMHLEKYGINSVRNQKWFGPANSDDSALPRIKIDGTRGLKNAFRIYFKYGPFNLASDAEITIVFIGQKLRDKMVPKDSHAQAQKAADAIVHQHDRRPFDIAIIQDPQKSERQP